MPSWISLPRDILVEILCRLAVNDLLRFRCVSKGCRDLIDSPDFVKFHLSHSLKTNSHRFLIILGKSKPYSLDLDSLEIAQVKSNSDIFTDLLQVKFPILGSCNGLIALKTNNGDDIVICNPTTKKIRKVRRPNSRTLPAGHIFVGYGFGYDPVSDDYKLVNLSQSYNQRNNKYISTTLIYSLKSGYWRKTYHETPCFPNLPFNKGNAILVNNVLHWMIDTDESKNIVAFDLTSKKFHDVPPPILQLEKTTIYLELKELGGCLWMICSRHCESCDDSYLDIWVMKEYGIRESWTFLWSLEMCEDVPTLWFPVAYSKCGQKVLLWFFDNQDRTDRDMLVWYNLEGKRLEDMEIRDVPVPDYDRGIEVCIATLVSPTPTPAGTTTNCASLVSPTPKPAGTTTNCRPKRKRRKGKAKIV
ncbi:hypothetical protein COLO4_09297 [Corchorus olitorius]|uniref:F-box domain-containing protein n=1 Tax=Corchorus olitorius TaxID=93759 RepID=A0A1R3KCH6_9ROSI|nr:hypothetical protein COLO4_09297 [Corchorus olitorius]